MDRRVGVEPGDQVQELTQAGVSWKFVQPAGHADLFARLALAADIDLAGRVVADQDRGQPRPDAVGLDKFPDGGGRFFLHRLSKFFPVEQSSRHRFLDVNSRGMA